jgi:hypothetical protein
VEPRGPRNSVIKFDPAILHPDSAKDRELEKTDPERWKRIQKERELLAVTPSPKSKKNASEMRLKIHDLPEAFKSNECGAVNSYQVRTHTYIIRIKKIISDKLHIIFGFWQILGDYRLVTSHILRKSRSATHYCFQ